MKTAPAGCGYAIRFQQFHGGIARELPVSG
jgi:hypothetical protein